MGFLAGDKKTLLENTLFGTDDADPTLPSADDLITLLSESPEPGPGPEPAPEYEEVTPVGTENPSQEGWYEYDATATPQYFLTSDTTVDSEKTYYKLKETTGGEG